MWDRNRYGDANMKTFFKRSKYFIGLGVASLLTFSTLFALVPAQSVQADHASGSWIDNSTIRINGRDYKYDTAKSPPNGTYHTYTATSVYGTGSCKAKGFVEFPENPTLQGTSASPGFLDELVSAGAIEGGFENCQWDRDHRVTLGSVDNAKKNELQAQCSNMSADRMTECIERAAANSCPTTPPSSPDAVAACIAAFKAKYSAPNSGGIGSEETAAEPDPQLNCDVSWNPLTWILCPVVDLINATINGLDAAINSLLTVEQEQIFDETTDSGKGYRAAWEAFRGIALGILVIAAIIMIIGQALGFELLDAYTIKKVIPRLFVAILGISLSWQLTEWFVGFTNDLGLGIRALIYFPFRDINKDGIDIIGGGEATLLTLLTFAGIKGLGFMGLLSFGGTALLAILIGFFVLILRQIVIVVLVLFAPIAIACYILPNTQGVWKLWYESFTKAMMMFPIIVAFLAVGRVLALVSSGPGATALGQIIGFIAYILPYFLIPLTFRFAGGALRTLGGFVNDQGRGGFDRLKKYRQGQFQSHGGVLAKRAGERTLQARYKAYNKLGAAADTKSNSWLTRKAAGRAQSIIGGYNIQAQISANNADKIKAMGDQIATGPDSNIRAYTVNKEFADKLAKDDAFAAREAASRGVSVQQLRDEYIDTTGDTTKYRTMGGAWVTESEVAASQQAFGVNNHAAFQKAVDYEMGKANTQEEQDHLVNSFGVSSERFKLDKDQASEVWIGAAYSKQNENRQWKHHKWDYGSNGRLKAKVAGHKLMQDIDEGQGNYQMMLQDADTWTTMSEEMVTAQQVVNSKKGKYTDKQVAEARETLERGARIAHATKSASMAGTPIGDGGDDAPPAGSQRISGGREIGAGAPARVMQEMKDFVQIAEEQAAMANMSYSPDARAGEGLQRRSRER